MFENFKTDIIYYNTATDFELEFNICGCCRMRLFNDKCTDKKSLLLSLSRAVSRSRVIIITAPLFSDENVIGTVASAIGSKVETVNNAEYNIASDAEISVIRDSLPLVTEDGIFGGCIIESGPQSLILLTDNKTVRKTIMKNLIHPYIGEIASRADGAGEELVTETEDIEEEISEEIGETEEAEETEEELILESDYLADSEDAAEEDGAGIFTETDEETDITDESFEPEIEGLYTDIDRDNLIDGKNGGGYYEDEYYTEETEGKTSAFNIWMLVISIILLVTLAVLCYCIFYVPTKAGVTPSVYLNEIFDTMFK